MKLHPRSLNALREAIASCGGSALRLADVDVYPGTTRFAPHSAVVCHFHAGPVELVRKAAEEASRLIHSRIGVQTGWGVEECEDSVLCWIEYFPGSADYTSAQFALRALQTAFMTIGASKSGNPSHAREAAQHRSRFESSAGPQVFVQCQFLISAARAANIPVHNIGRSPNDWQFGWGSRSEIFHKTASMNDSVPGHQITWRKDVTKWLFRELGLPTPPWHILSPTDDHLRAAKQIGWPCVVKPLNQAFGIGVTANVRTPAELEEALAAGRAHTGRIILEAQEEGADHRLMIVDGRLVAAARREPPFVTGDGVRNVGELIHELNKGRDGTRERGYLLPVEMDEALYRTLAKERLSTDSVLEPGRALVLRSIGNFSTGGSAVDVTSDVHPQVKQMAELLAEAVGLRTAGIDYVTRDISRSHSEVGGGFIEVNAMPRLRLLMMGSLSEGDIGRMLLGDKPGRIPVTLIVANAQALAELAQPVRNRTAAMEGAAAVSVDWIQIGTTELTVATLDAFTAACVPLRHLAVNELVILWSSAEIRQFGLPVDEVDRAIIVGGEIDDSWIGGRCVDIQFVEQPRDGLHAAFPPRSA